jgi:peptidyl-prolyl cis-trans isomerase C
MGIKRGIASLARHRLVQFAALGSLIFALTPRDRASREIALTSAELDRLLRAEGSKRGHADAALVDERAIEDEVLYREGLRIGFDKSDAIIRQRLIQKVLFFAEELKGAGDPPSDDELRRFYALTEPTWRKAGLVHLRQIFMKKRAPLEALRPALERKEAVAFAKADAGPLPQDLTVTVDELARLFGADCVRDLEGGSRILGPLQSAYGFHLIEVVDTVPGSIAPFEEVRDRVREVYLTKRREDAVSEYLKSAFSRYRVTIDGETVATISPVHRIAFRPVESAED